MPLRQTEWRIREVQSPVGLVHEIVRAVQAPAVGGIREHGDIAVPFETNNPSPPVLGDRQAPLRVDRETVRAREPELSDIKSRIPTLGSEDRDAIIDGPAINQVRSEVAEEQEPLRHPHGPLERMETI